MNDDEKSKKGLNEFDYYNISNIKLRDPGGVIQARVDKLKRASRMPKATLIKHAIYQGLPLLEKEFELELALVRKKDRASEKEMAKEIAEFKRKVRESNQKGIEQDEQE